MKILAIGKGSPGENGVPGDTFTNRQMFERIQRGKPLWERLGLCLPSAKKKVERGLEAFRKVSGIESRQVFTGNTSYPNACLATAACIDTIKAMEKRNPSFDKSKIDGFVFVTDTSDNVFPVSGKLVARALDIRPRHFSNASLVCSSMVNAIQTAASWMEFDPNCKYVLVAACDITTRLHQPAALKQPFLFGDQAVAFILEKTSGKGGFISSNLYMDPTAPDIVHFPLYTGDSRLSQNTFSASRRSNGNDINLKTFGAYETKAIAALYQIFLRSNNVVDDRKRITINSQGASGQIDLEEKIVLPQVARKVVQESGAAFDCKILREHHHVEDGMVSTRGITGAAGTPLALWKMNLDFPLDTAPWSAFSCGIGGVSGILRFDPYALENFRLGFNIDPEELRALTVEDIKPASDNKERTNESIPVMEAKPVNKRPLEPITMSTIDHIVTMHILRQLQTSL